jgi:hypothetical protein
MERTEMFILTEPIRRDGDAYVGIWLLLIYLPFIFSTKASTL